MKLFILVMLIFIGKQSLCGQVPYVTTDLKTGITDTLDFQKSFRYKMLADIQEYCDSSRYDLETKALILAFATIRTKNFTAPNTLYNNIFGAINIIQGLTMKVQNVEGIGWTFPTLSDVFLNLYLLTVRLNIDKFSPKAGVERLIPSYEDISKSLVFMTKGSLTEKEAKEIMDQYDFIVNYLKMINNKGKIYY